MESLHNPLCRAITVILLYFLCRFFTDVAHIFIYKDKKKKEPNIYIYIYMYILLEERNSKPDLKSSIVYKYCGQRRIDDLVNTLCEKRA